jgi:hypothetical protein
VNDTDVAARLAEALFEHQSWCHAVAHGDCCKADDCDCGVTDSLHRLLPVVREIADQRAAEELDDLARHLRSRASSATDRHEDYAATALFNAEDETLKRAAAIRGATDV